MSDCLTMLPVCLFYTYLLRAQALDAQREAEASRSRAAESSGALVKVRAEADALKQVRSIRESTITYPYP